MWPFSRSADDEQDECDHEWREIKESTRYKLSSPDDHEFDGFGAAVVVDKSTQCQKCPVVSGRGKEIEETYEFVTMDEFESLKDRVEELE